MRVVKDAKENLDSALLFIKTNNILMKQRTMNAYWSYYDFNLTQSECLTYSLQNLFKFLFLVSWVLPTTSLLQWETIAIIMRHHRCEHVCNRVCNGTAVSCDNAYTETRKDLAPNHYHVEWDAYFALYFAVFCATMSSMFENYLHIIVCVSNTWARAKRVKP